MRPERLLALIPCTVLVIAACSSSSDRDQVVVSLTDRLETEASISADDAECLADAIVDDLGSDAIREAGLDTGDDAFNDLDQQTQDEIFASARQALDDCNLDPDALDE